MTVQEREGKRTSPQEIGIRHNCGIFGIYAPGKDVSSLGLQMLYSLNHRGQEGAGIAASDGRESRAIKGSGFVREVFRNGEVGELQIIKPHIAIGQTRYSTAGDLDAWQPITEGGIDLVHNGNLTNVKRQLNRLPFDLRSRAVSDSWVAQQVIIHSKGDTWQGKIRNGIREFEGAYNFIIIAEDKMYALRDPWGNHPLVIGELPNKTGIVVASETSAFLPIGARLIREVHEGEGVEVSKEGLRNFFIDERTDLEKIARCIFELLYMAAPDSEVYGKLVSEVRQEWGRMLARRDLKKGFLPDRILPVQQSGVLYAVGYAKEMIRQVSVDPLRFGIETQDKLSEVLEGFVPVVGLVSNPYAGRVFIEPGNRNYMSTLKHRASAYDISGKKIVFLEDSIVRGNAAQSTSYALMNHPELLGYEPPEEIHMRVAAPPIMHPCFFGVDFPTKEELIAAKKNGNIEAIRKWIKQVKTLEYLGHREIIEVVVGKERMEQLKDIPDEELYERSGYCGSCFTGRYNIPVTDVMPKQLAAV